MPALTGVANAVRIRKDWFVGLVVLPYVTGRAPGADFFLEYDDGTDDIINIPEKTTVSGTAQLQIGASRAKKNGWVVGLSIHDAAAQGPSNNALLQFVISSDENFSRYLLIAVGELAVDGFVQPATFLRQTGPIWVAQGTVLEDATAGTHVATLTVVPGAGNAIDLLYGQITVGATATAQTARIYVDDGTNILSFLMNGTSQSATTSGLRYPYPQVGQQTVAVLAADVDFVSAPAHVTISGTMRLIADVTTVAVSVTQSFAIVGRLLGRGVLPTITFADTVGAPVLTTNTNGVF